MKFKNLYTVLFAAIVTLALIRSSSAQKMVEMETFFSQIYPGISINLNATRETSPGQNIMTEVSVNCRSLDIVVESLNVTMYGFKEGKDKITLANLTCFEAETPITFNETTLFNLTTLVPAGVWDTTYVDLHLSYMIGGEPHAYSPSFSATLIRNVYLEDLEQQLKNLNESLRSLNNTYWRLNNTYIQLNQTYWNLQQKYNSTQTNAEDLYNARRVTVILGITAAFFVASTVYLIIRKPREYW